MSVINSNPFGGAFPPGAGFPNFENGGATAPEQAFRQAPDDVAATPWNAPPGFPSGAAPAPGTDASWSFGSVMNDFMNAVSSLLGQLGSALGTAGSTRARPARRRDCRRSRPQRRSRRPAARPITRVRPLRRSATRTTRSTARAATAPRAATTGTTWIRTATS